jgi:hypothetical protein
VANKKITDLSLIASITDSVNFAVDNTVQSFRCTAAQLLTYIRANAQNYLLSSKTSDYVILDTDNIRTIKATNTTSSFTFTASDVTAASDTIGETAHGLSNGDSVMITGDNSGAPLPLKAGVDYFVVNTAADTFKLAATVGGTAIDITGTGGGVMTVWKNQKITLPLAANNTNRIITVIKTNDTFNRVVIVTAAGAKAFVLYNQNESVTFQSDGTDWLVIERKRTINSSALRYAGNGHGSVGTRVRKFSSADDGGKGVIHGSDLTNGDWIMALQPGRYHCSYSDGRASGGTETFVISKNASSTTTATSLVHAEIISNTDQQATGSFYVSCGATVDLAAGDIIKAHTTGSASQTTSRVFLQVTQVTITD